MEEEYTNVTEAENGFSTGLITANGHSMIALLFDGKKIFKFGIKKAFAIVSCIKHIEKFVEENSGK